MHYYEAGLCAVVFPVSRLEVGYQVVTVVY